MSEPRPPILPAEWLAPRFDLVAHIHRARAFSEKAFGPASRPHGIVEHIRKELCEIEMNPLDLEEWIDVMILAIDGAWRAGYEPEEIVAALAAKQTKNEARKWPDWRTVPEGAPIEHDRSAEQTDLFTPEMIDEELAIATSEANEMCGIRIKKT